jgi:hypothetical protein
MVAKLKAPLRRSIAEVVAHVLNSDSTVLEDPTVHRLLEEISKAMIADRKLHELAISQLPDNRWKTLHVQQLETVLLVLTWLLLQHAMPGDRPNEGL